MLRKKVIHIHTKYMDEVAARPDITDEAMVLHLSRHFKMSPKRILKAIETYRKVKKIQPTQRGGDFV